MSWCLECHRAPEDHLVDTDVLQVTDLMRVENQIRSDGQKRAGLKLAQQKRLEPSVSCGTCHY